MALVFLFGWPRDFNEQAGFFFIIIIVRCFNYENENLNAAYIYLRVYIRSKLLVCDSSIIYLYVGSMSAYCYFTTCTSNLFS